MFAEFLLGSRSPGEREKAGGVGAAFTGDPRGGVQVEAKAFLG